MQILIISDIHNDIENLMSLLEKIQESFDVVVCPGDFTDINLPRGFEKIEMIEIILEMLKTLKKPILALPGNLDGSESIELFKKKGINLHGKGIKINDVGFYGYGGARTPFNTPLEPSEGELEIGLEKSYREVADCEVKVQVTHMPPNGTKIDLLYTGAHAGSDVVRNFILKKKPKVAISAHIHEARGIDELEGTKLINSGRFPEGYCGIVKVGMKNIEAKIINLI